jgi:hypothetical protein
VTEWKLCIRLFLWGFPNFFVSLGLMAWMRFHAVIAAPVAITCVSVAGLVVLLVSTGHNKGVPGFVGSSNMETADVASKQQQLQQLAAAAGQHSTARYSEAVARAAVAAAGPGAAQATSLSHHNDLSASDVEAARAIDSASHDGKRVTEHLPELGDEYRGYVEHGGEHDSWAGPYAHA